MSQRDELAKVKARIKALAAKTVDAGCSEEEAMLAAAKVGELLQQFGLTMSEVDIREEVCRTINIHTDFVKRDERLNLLFTLAHFTDTKSWYYTGNRAKIRFAFFGQDSDLLMVEYLYRVMTSAIATEVLGFKKTLAYRNAPDKRVATQSFRTGMVRRLRTRLTQMKQERDAVVQAAENARRDEARAAAEAQFRVENAERAARVEAIHQTLKRGGQVEVEDYAALNAFDVEVATARSSAVTGGTGLIVLKGQLVEQEYEKLGMKMGKAKPLPRVRRTDERAYSAGIAAGNRVNLSRPVEGGARPAGLLG